MANGTMEKIETVTVGAGGTASITFSNIPATYDDLLIKISLRADTTADYISLRFNSSTTNFTSRYILSDGAGASSGSRTDTFQSATVNLSTWTASIFSNADIYIPNYRGNTNKSFSIDTVNENNATTAYMELIAGLWSNTSAITSITMVSGAGSSNFVQHSTATLYGITRVPAGAKATGGVIYDDSSYWYHVFTSSGTLTPSQSITADMLVVAGGGGGGGNIAGGGGGGEIDLFSSNTVNLSSASYTVTIGAGGAGGATNQRGTNGGNSSVSGTGITTITALGGGGGGTAPVSSGVGANGGSGGGGAAASGGAAGGTASGNNTFAGGTGNFGPYPHYASGGGGGATAVGSNGSGSGSVGGNGGAGYLISDISSFVSGILPTMTRFSSGGGGCGENPSNTGGTGGTGGAGAGNGGSGSAMATSASSYGSGGGGGNWENRSGGGVGGSGFAGIVIVRYAK